MDVRALRNVDLNLLLAFSVLMRERHVSRAARSLGIGQPGLSGALARLRATFGDRLLVRVGAELHPTPRALELTGPVEQALELISQSLAATRVFSPDTSERTFRLGMTDDHELLFAPSLAAALATAAPRARLVIRPTDVHTVHAALDSGQIDVALGVIRAERIPSWHTFRILFSEGYQWVWSPRRLDLPRRLTLERYVALPHVLVTFDGTLEGRVDEVLARRRRRRKVMFGVPRFGALPEILAAFPAISTVPTQIARCFSCRHGLATSPVPIHIAPLTYGLISRVRDAEVPDLDWFALLVSRIVGDVVRSIA